MHSARFIFIFILLFHQSFGQWTKTQNTPLIIHNFTTTARPGVIYATNGESILKSTDYGRSWEYVSKHCIDFRNDNGYYFGSITDLKESSRDSNVLFVSSVMSGIHKSTNGGNSWTSHKFVNNPNSGLEATQCLFVEINPFNPDNIFVSDHVSTNHGNSWLNETGFLSPYDYAFFPDGRVFKSLPQTTFGAPDVYYSDNYGVSFSLVNTIDIYMMCRGFNGELLGVELFAPRKFVLKKSTDNGQTFSFQGNKVFEFDFVTNLLYDSVNHLLYAAFGFHDHSFASDSIFVSADNGLTWQPLILPNSDIRSFENIYLDPEGNLYVTSYLKPNLFFYERSSGTWHERFLTGPEPGGYNNIIVYDDHKYFLNRNGIFISDDNGQSYTSIDIPFDCGPYNWSRNFSVLKGDNLYFICTDGSLYRLNLASNTFTDLGQNFPPNLNPLTGNNALVNFENSFYLMYKGTYVLGSDDLGNTWRVVADVRAVDPMGFKLLDIFVDPQTGRLFLYYLTITTDSKIVYSDDSGNSFHSLISLDPVAHSCYKQNPASYNPFTKSFFISSTVNCNSILKIDSAGNATVIDFSNVECTGSFMQTIGGVYASHYQNRVYVSTIDSFIMISPDDGQTWSRFPDLTNLPANSCYLVRNFIETPDSLLYIYTLCGEGYYNQNDIPLAIGQVDANSEKHLKIYPNPTTGIFHIYVPDEWHNNKPLRVEIFDITGARVSTMFTRAHKLQIDADSFSPGVYFINVSHSSGSGRAKILITR